MRTIPCAALCVLALAAGGPLAAQSCEPTVIATASAGSPETMWPAIAGFGGAVAFRSDRDLVPGSNADGSWELFRWTSSGVEQLTDTAPGPLLAIGPPAISNDGESIVFVSSLDLTGGNADGNYEVFLLELPSTVTQITDTTGIMNDGPVISGDGQVVAFTSAADLVGSNADASIEVFTWQAGTGFQQLTDTTVDNGFPSIDLAGTTIAHLSSADLTPPGNADGSSEVFRQTPPTVTQITDLLPADFVDHPRLSQLGGRIVFASSADLVPPGNADHSIELFLFDPTGGFSQLTSATGAGFIGLPSVAATADVVVFQSNRDLVPAQNGDGSSEIFVWRSGSGLAQLTSSPATSHNTNPTVSLGGEAFAHEQVTEAERSVVLTRCLPRIAEVPVAGHAGLATLAALLAGIGLLALRARAR